MSAEVIRSSLDHTLSFIRDLDRARNVHDVAAKVLAHLSRFGVEYMVASTIPMAESNRRQQLSHVLLNKWPPEWANRYASRRYVAYDATIQRLTKSPEPFSWSELDPLVRNDPKARRVLDEAAEFNLKEGFALSLQTLDKQIVLFSAGGRHFEMNPDTQGVLTLVANYAEAGEHFSGADRPLPARARSPAMGGGGQKRLGNRRDHENLRAWCR
jgi:LuxR family quorum sensing-dependent transcriptional regulator